jgi:hypothetical protein
VAVEAHRLGARVLGGLAGEALVRQYRLRPVVERGVPALAQLVLLLGGQHRYVVDGPVGVGDEVLHQQPQVPPQALHSGPVEQVGVVLEPAAQVALLLEDLQLQVETRGGAVHVDGLQAQPGHVEVRHRDVLEDERDLEDGRAGQVAARLQLLDDALERQLLVGQRAQAHLPHPGQQLPERGVAGQVGTQRERVDEEPDQPLDLGSLAPRDRYAHHDVVLAAVPVQQHLERGEQGHERGRAFAPGQRLDARHHRLGQLEPAGAAAPALYRRPGPVGRQLQHGRRAGERLLPVLHLGDERVALHPLALPHRVVRVLDRQLG